MDTLNYKDVFEEDENSGFTWEVKANNRYYHWQFKEKVFLCYHRSKYQTNVIRTAKYSIFSFLPLNLYEQFNRVSNLYFLLMIVLQGIPEISTLPWFTLFTPLICLLFIRAARDLVDDIGRHRNDTAVNNRPCQILVGKRFLWRKWKDLCVGDVVCMQKDSVVPADMLLLASTEPSSLCYVETADIDGETNLKFRQALAVTHRELNNVSKMAAFQGKVVCEKPNSRMHSFVGCLEWKGRKYPLDPGNILLRGCKIRNTSTCYGLVIYAGFDTKIMKNCGKIHMKRTKLDLLMNRMVVMIFLFLLLVSIALSLGSKYKFREFKTKHHYISSSYKHTESTDTFFTFWGFLILLSVLVPMAMFISAEFIHLGNSVFINWDAQMYYAPLDMPAKARSTSLNDQLGQVEYVFSDKTGTLTQNIMTFKKCCIQGRVYGPDEDTVPKENPYLWNEFADGKLLYHNPELLSTVRANQDRIAREFWRLLALCHTVMVQEQNNQFLYQAASPDEEALVTAARNFGYVFRSRTQDTVTVMELGQERVYKVLAMMDFNSVRKRMSVLVRSPEGSIFLYTKGADTVIFERLSKRDTTEAATEEALSAFADETLRTLCLAYKEVQEDAYEEWSRQHQEASLLLQNRAQALHQVYEEMEQNLQLLGATAIEDKLQDGVPDTIKCLKNGNIKVWVLTGDKQETAVNVGFACELLTKDMIILEEKQILRTLGSNWNSNNKLQDGKSRVLPLVKTAMVVSGDFLDQLLIPASMDKSQTQSAGTHKFWQEANQQQAASPSWRLPQMWRSLVQRVRSVRQALRPGDAKPPESPEARRERAFVDLAVHCQAVICCRVTPKQKALIVKLIQKYRRVVTLAIGDGANDVNMIKTADIGVGLAGQEGMQAVQNSDYVVAQFRFLQRLLLVHGRWSYLRTCKFLRYFIYKTVASMMAQIWFAFFSGFSAQPLYEGWFLALFNLLYSTLPVLSIGLFEQDVSAERSLQMPQLYMAGQKEELFNYWVFVQALAHGVATSLINFFVTLLACHDAGGPSSLSDHQSFAVIIAVSGLLSVTMEVMLITRYWTILTVLAICLSLTCYAIMTYATQSFWLFKVSSHTFPFLYADRNVLSEPLALLVILLNVSLSTLSVLALRIIYQAIKSRLKVEEPPSEEVTMEAIQYLQRESPFRRSSYAFSHREGYANLITQGTILRRAWDTNSELMNEEQPPSEDEMSLGFRESSWHPRKLSFLIRRKHPHMAKIHSAEGHTVTLQNSLFPVERQTPSDLRNRSQSPFTMRSLSSEQRPFSFRDRSPSPGQRPRSSQDRSQPPGQRSSLKDWGPLPEESLPSANASPLPPLEGQALPSDQPPPEDRPLEKGPSLWRTWKPPWAFIWQNKFFANEETEPVPETSQSHTEESFVTQPMEIEPPSVEREPSAAEWPPTTTEDQFQSAVEELPPSPPKNE